MPGAVVVCFFEWCSLLNTTLLMREGSVDGKCGSDVEASTADHLEKLSTAASCECPQPKVRWMGSAGVMLRRAPRIISRSSRRQRLANAPSQSVMMRIADQTAEKWKPVKRFFIDVSNSEIYQDARYPEAISSSDDEPRLTVEVSALPGDGQLLHCGDNLPGVANEVESYPCRFCANRIFLTSMSLERHTKVEHKEHLGEVKNDIYRIQSEWRR
ncbi:unnamed protein product [Gongylonema pulchrum]|uniref:C2H2-type domain-containing protein n=1 Tax=Gongylonema pulchrum TaxID=637853 RepID=A0A183ECG1_9BILA|nr:unnamed protein product [Gongylonema pulchrum]